MITSCLAKLLTSIVWACGIVRKGISSGRTPFLGGISQLDSYLDTQLSCWIRFPPRPDVPFHNSERLPSYPRESENSLILCSYWRGRQHYCVIPKVQTGCSLVLSESSWNFLPKLCRSTNSHFPASVRVRIFICVSSKINQPMLLICNCEKGNGQGFLCIIQFSSTYTTSRDSLW